jgi:16S rRNA (uracil1498-N3)-methyltransferase
MPHNRYFLPSEFSSGSTVEVGDPELHHMTKVMRQRPSDRVELINGKGLLAEALIEQIDKTRALLRIESLYIEKKRSNTLTLCLAYLRPSSLEFAVEKSVELGVDQILLFPAARSEKKEINASQTRRLEQIIISATKQCGRLFLPTIAFVTFDDCLKSSKGIYYGDPDCKSFEKVLKPDARSIIIGPESGFTKEEKEKMSLVHAHPFLLSRYTLRAETAAIAAVTLFAIQ